MSIWDQAHLLEACPPEFRITLGEGGTSLVRSRAIGPKAGMKDLFFKLEFLNPTGSYKDRFAAAAVSHMLARGQQSCISTSSGNTGAALAAYCGAAGISCEIAVVETAPPSKLQQMQLFGATVYRIRGFGLDDSITRDVFAWLRARSRTQGTTLQISAHCDSPLGMNGVQTIAHELAAQDARLDRVIVPTGGGGLALAIARGYDALIRAGAIGRSPAIDIAQPAGNDTIVTSLNLGLERARRVKCTSSVSGLQVPDVLDGDTLIAAARSTGGSGVLVADEAAFAMQRRLAREEGLFCEPAAALAAAAAIESPQPDQRTCCILTGAGFKDSTAFARLAGPDTPILELENLKH